MNSEREYGDLVENPSWASRGVAWLVMITGLLVLVWVIIRNEPFKEPVFVQAMRVFLSLSAGFAAAGIPGFLRLSIGTTQRRITAAGALGFAVLTYLGTPLVAPSLAPENVQQAPPDRIPCRVWSTFAYLEELSEVDGLRERFETRRVFWFQWVLNMLDQIDEWADRTVVVESDTFEHPYPAFNAVVQTFSDPKRSHILIPFLVQAREQAKSFTPLYYTYSPEHQQNILHIPQSERGDYLLIVARLDVEPASIGTGRAVPFVLYRL